MRLLVAAAACLLPLIASAGPTMTSEIEKIRVRPSVAYVKLADCVRYNRIYLDTEYGKAMLSAALAAATAGLRVSVEFEAADGCQSTESLYLYFEVIYD